jgi:hypothetical protein
VTSTSAGWNPIGQTLTYSANNGNKEFVVTTPSDLSSFLTPGQKIMFARGTAPPTQSMAFTAASSQYATKTAPAGLSYTATFTHEAWVYLNSYSNGAIVGRVDSSAANGAYLGTGSSGQLNINGFNAGASNYRVGTTYQSLPLKRWVHVAATWSTGTILMYINGVSVPFAVTTSGTAPTTIVNSGDLSVGRPGAFNGQYFDGYISEARIWSAAQSQANIQANMAISLTGSESNLVALFQGNGNFNDKTSNANNLTATNGAIATQAANPYNSTEYGIITKVTSTQLTIFTGTDYTIPNMTLNSPYYSTARAPQGFPAGRDKWRVDSLYMATTTQSSPTGGTWYNIANAVLPVPTGPWNTGLEGNLTFAAAAASTGLGQTDLSLASASAAVLTPQTGSITYGASSGTSFTTLAPLKYSDFATFTALTPVYANVTSQNTVTSIGWQAAGNAKALVLTAECAYI